MPSNNQVASIPVELLIKIKQHNEQIEQLLNEVMQYCPKTPDTGLNKNIRFIRIFLSPSNPRRIEYLDQHIETNAHFFIDLNSNELKIAGDKYLNPAPTRLLAFLLLHQNRYFTYKEIADSGCLKNKHYQNFVAIEKYISQIRIFCSRHNKLLEYGIHSGIPTRESGNDKDLFYHDKDSGMARSTTTAIKIKLNNDAIILLPRSHIDWLGLGLKKIQGFRQNSDWK